MFSLPILKGLRYMATVMIPLSQLRIGITNMSKEGEVGERLSALATSFSESILSNLESFESSQDDLNSFILAARDPYSLIKHDFSQRTDATQTPC